jgi:hypothetical protein
VRLNASKPEQVLDVGDDQQLRRALTTKAYVEIGATLVSVACLVYFYLPDDFGETLKRKIKDLRCKFFGPEPLSEEQIKRYGKWTIVEAMRVVREADV